MFTPNATDGEPHVRLRKFNYRPATEILYTAQTHVECTGLYKAMETATPDNLTGSLRAWQDGDDTALERLTPVVYDEIRRIAHRLMQRERNGHTLNTTALVNEAYVRLIDERQIHWTNRSHFFAVVGRVMRHVLIDYARRRLYLKRAGEARKVPLEEAAFMTADRARELVALDEALVRLRDIDSRKAAVVELRYFGGLDLEETATVLGISTMTVRRDWRAARAWLYREVSQL